MYLSMTIVSSTDGPTHNTMSTAELQMRPSEIRMDFLKTGLSHSGDPAVI